MGQHAGVGQIAQGPFAPASRSARRSCCHRGVVGSAAGPSRHSGVTADSPPGRRAASGIGRARRWGPSRPVGVVRDGDVPAARVFHGNGKGCAATRTRRAPLAPRLAPVVTARPLGGRPATLGR